MANETRAVHDFCWINMITPNPAEAQQFYSRLLGWTFSDMPGMGWIINVEGTNIGGFFDQAHPNTPPGTKPQLGVMVKVADVDSSAAKVKSLGGTVHDLMDIGPNGRMAGCVDSEGARIDLWQPKSKTGMDINSRAHGAPSWFEVMEKNVEKAKAFYRSLFGWTTESMPMPGFEYTVFKNDGRAIAGMYPLMGAQIGMSPVWATYFTVSDIKTATTLAAELGGTVHVPVTEIPSVGKFAYLESPQGVMFYVIEYTA